MNKKMDRMGVQTVTSSNPKTYNMSAPGSTVPKQKKLRKLTPEEKAARRERKRLEQTANF